MRTRNRILAATLAVLVTFAFGPSTAAPAPKDTARYTAGPGVVPVASRTVPEPAGSTTGIPRVGIGGLAGGTYAGWRGAKLTLREDSGANGGIGVTICYGVGGCAPPSGFQIGFCTAANGSIDLRRVPFKPGVPLSIRIGVVQPDGVFTNVPGCDVPPTTGTIYVTYCKNKKKSKFC